jgi:hypothetical protein
MNWIALGLFFKVLLMRTPEGLEGKLKKEKMNIQKVGRLPSVINESSGIAFDSSRSVFYSINDSGGRSTVYVTDTLFQLIDSIQLHSIRNIDWEEILYRNDTLVIGDFGNNKNVRHNLNLYEYVLSDSSIHAIPYSYNNQKKFPPDTLDFDCEAFGYVEGVYYLVSKNRSDNYAQLYKLQKEHSIAIKQMDLPIKGMVTAASIHYQGDLNYKWAILSYGIIYFIEQKIVNNVSEWVVCSYKKIGFAGQSEAIVWVNSNELILTNENGKVWKLHLKN